MNIVANVGQLAAISRLNNINIRVWQEDRLNNNLTIATISELPEAEKTIDLFHTGNHFQRLSENPAYWTQGWSTQRECSNAIDPTLGPAWTRGESTHSISQVASFSTHSSAHLFAVLYSFWH